MTLANRGPAAAAQNRVAIIKAAGEIFAEQGLDAPLNAIAKRAGVGQGSLYRHFPNRESLALVAFESNLGEIEALAASSGSLARVLTMVVDQATSSTAFIQLAAGAARDQQALGLDARIRAVIASTLDEGRASGTVPAAFDVDDVVMAIRLLAGALIGSLPSERAELVEHAWRLLGIRLD
jgi:AcrR family transcriptional regulator